MDASDTDDRELYVTILPAARLALCVGADGTLRLYRDGRLVEGRSWPAHDLPRAIVAYQAMRAELMAD